MMATKKRLIDANELLTEVVKAQAMNEDPNKIVAKIIMLITDAPTVDAVEVVHGEWSTIEDDYCGLTALKCSECNQEYWFEEEPPMKIYNYCPNCGAKMDRERSAE